MAAALILLTTGYSSCAGTTGPLFVPLTITPNQVLLRSSQALRQEAVALARVDGGEAGDRYTATVEYGKDAGTGWLTIFVSGRELTLRARPDGLEIGTRVATVVVAEERSGASATLAVEYEVTR
jgi:hypothetical protein